VSVAIYKTSYAEIKAASANALVRITDIENPENVFIDALRGYFTQVGFSETYPNFGNINIGAVHPFILLLFADIMDEKQDFSIFPSITVADSSMEDAHETLGRETEYINVTAQDVAVFESYRERGLHISDTGLASMKAATVGGKTIVGRKTTHITKHSYDFNIWSDNKEITNFIFEIVDAFLTTEVEYLHERGVDIQGMSGRKTGDINMEFGRILYGANITATVTVIHTDMVVNPVLYTIAKIDTTTLPSYFAPSWRVE